jgi:hypothetical protein
MRYLPILGLVILNTAIFYYGRWTWVRIRFQGWMKWLLALVTVGLAFGVVPRLFRSLFPAAAWDQTRASSDLLFFVIPMLVALGLRQRSQAQEPPERGRAHAPGEVLAGLADDAFVTTPGRSLFFILLTVGICVVLLVLALAYMVVFPNGILWPFRLN